MPFWRISKTAIFVLTVCATGQSLWAGDQSKPAVDDCIYQKCWRSGPWFVVETDNFQACCLDSYRNSEIAGIHCRKAPRKAASRLAG